MTDGKVLFDADIDFGLGDKNGACGGRSQRTTPF